MFPEHSQRLSVDGFESCGRKSAIPVGEKMGEKMGEKIGEKMGEKMGEKIGEKIGEKTD